MKTEEIIDRLRNPQKYAQPTKSPSKKEDWEPGPLREKTHIIGNLFIAILVTGIVFLLAVTWKITLREKRQADNLAATVTPQQVEGLSADEDFNPRKGVTYVKIQEGQDRNVAVEELGTTLPIISSANYQSITPSNYSIIGMAPWALTTNFASNINDTQMIRYLLNRPEVGEAFIAREDVSPLLQDAQLLAALAQNEQAVSDFFNDTTVQQVLANEEMVRTVAGSRFVSLLLTSKAVKHFRDNPKEAVLLINSSPTLSSLRQNSGVRKAVEENYYLKSIAAQLLAAPAVRTATPAKQGANASTKKVTSSTPKKTTAQKKTSKAKARK